MATTFARRQGAKRNAMWASIFTLIGKTLDVVNAIISRKKPVDESTDGVAARSGTTAGAAAYEAGKAAKPK